jgi:hypothetical protein
MGRIFTIPDIHGRRDLFEALLEKLHTEEGLNFSNGDKLVLLGDYVDRGTDSCGVLEIVRKLQADHTNNVIALAGNHEWLLIDGCIGNYEAFNLWMWNGGDATRRSFPGEHVPEETIKWLASLPLSHEEQGFFFSHAPVPPEEYRARRLEGQPYAKEELTWTYLSGKHEKEMGRVHGESIVGVCGHIHALRENVFAPRFYDHYIFADAGAGCHSKAPLVAIEVKSRKVIYSWPESVTKMGDV